MLRVPLNLPTARRRWRAAILLISFAWLAPVASEARSYSAERFDVAIRLLDGGDMEVTETIVFRFEDGTFRHVFREIPARRTDGLDILHARMDGRALPLGDDVGQVEVRYRSRVLVRWRFAPVSGSTHTFELKYLVRGVVRQQEDADVLAWRALPGQHAYTIDATRIRLESPATLMAEPRISSHRVNRVGVEREGGTLVVAGTGIRRNGWMEATLWFPPASITERPPLWQQRQTRADALAPRWMLAAGLVFVSGLVLLLAVRQRYDAPPREISVPDRLPAVPGDLPAGIAGAVAANGRVALEHAMATLFSLATRGMLVISEEPRGRFGQRRFTLRRQRSLQTMAPHEQVALDIAFTDKGRQEEAVSLSKARSRLTRHFKSYRRAVQDELAARGLLSEDRRRTYERYGFIAIVLLVLGALALLALAFLVPEYRGWPLLMGASLMLLAIVSLICQASTTPLSNTGVRQRDEWRAHQRHLKAVARDEAHLTTETPERVLPFAVALGLASAWSKYVKQHPAGAPTWFHAVSDATDGAFAAMIASAGAAGTGSGGGAGSGAAGGGASGAG